MKIVQINSVFGKGSTGKICLSIAELLKKEEIENCVLYSGVGVESPLGIKYTKNKKTKLTALKSRVCGNFGFNSVRETTALIEKLEELSPELVHLHNIHSHDCNFEMLLSYLKDRQIKTIWTFHDCWCFTGYCTYFDVVHCDKWKKTCNDCPQKKTFSLFLDKSSKLHNLKKTVFKGFNFTIVTPSKWLASLIKASFLRDVPVRVIYNGIDLDIFKPTKFSQNAIKKTDDKKVVLGVADVWGYRKGLDVFIKLSEMLPENYKIVLVGTDKKVDKKLPKSIVSIHRTNNQKELAAIYTAAEVFVNPTREEVLGLTNIEANACGTPVITFKSGGSPECIDETCGSVVECDDINALEKEIIRICEKHPYSKEDCINHAKAFDQNERFKEYVELYKKLL